MRELDSPLAAEQDQSSRCAMHPGLGEKPYKLVAYAVAVPFAWAVLALFLRTWIVEAFKIPSAGMLPTLLAHDHIFVDKRESGRAERGVVTVFRHPEHADEDHVKRVVGIPGDLVEMRQGRLWLNGWQVPRCVLGPSSFSDEVTGKSEQGTVAMEFLEGRAYLTFSVEEGVDPVGGSWQVGPGEGFVLGDFRTNSADSRTWFGGRGGGVPFGNVKGRALGIWLGLQGDSVDWSRSGQSLFAPELPRSMQALQPAFEKCLRERPNDPATVPPNAAR